MVTVAEKAILKVLYDNKSWMNINEISGEAGLAWQTTQRYLKGLKARHVVVSYENQDKYWKLNFKKIFSDKFHKEMKE